VFPEGISGYTAGTKVLQPKTDEVFECKPFPESGYCKQYSPSASHYEPGAGSHWHMAWDKL
jgi:chitin-binding protein